MLKADPLNCGTSLDGFTSTYTSLLGRALFVLVMKLTVGTTHTENERL